MAEAGGPQERQCPSCAGKGEVVQPVQVWDHQAHENRQVWRADTCSVCGGSGKVTY